MLESNKNPLTHINIYTVGVYALKNRRMQMYPTHSITKKEENVNDNKHNNNKAKKSLNKIHFKLNKWNELDDSKINKTKVLNDERDRKKSFRRTFQ